MKKRSNRFSSATVLLLLLALDPHIAGSQQFGFSAATVEPPQAVRVDAPGTVAVPVTVRIRRGYHINSDEPDDPYLIPTSLSWDPVGFRVVGVEFPAAERIRFEFSDAPLAVFSSRLEILTTLRFDAVPEALDELHGKFRYQACNDNSCLPPRTVAVTVPLRH